MHIFLSHRSTEKAFARKLFTSLQEENLAVWMDSEGGIEGGQIWTKAIEEGLREAYALVAVLSPAYVASDMCRKELSRAYQAIPIFPVLIETVPRFDIPIIIDDVQYIDFRGWQTDEGLYEERLQKLVTRLKTVQPNAAEPVETPTVGQAPAATHTAVRRLVFQDSELWEDAQAIHQAGQAVRLLLREDPQPQQMSQLAEVVATSTVPLVARRYHHARHRGVGLPLLQGPVRVLLSCVGPPDETFEARLHALQQAERIGDDLELVYETHISLLRLAARMRQARDGEPLHLWHHLQPNGPGLAFGDGRAAPKRLSVSQMDGILAENPSLMMAVVDCPGWTENAQIGAAWSIPFSLALDGEDELGLAAFVEAFYQATPSQGIDGALWQGWRALVRLGGPQSSLPLPHARVLDDHWLI
jgi:hypothetical protein